MTPLIRRLVELSIHFDKSGMSNLAKLLTEAIVEIENARYIRNQADESAKQEGDEKQSPGGGTGL